MTEHRNEDLDITFVAKNYEDHAPTDVKEEDPLMTHATSEGVVAIEPNTYTK